VQRKTTARQLQRISKVPRVLGLDTKLVTDSGIEQVVWKDDIVVRRGDARKNMLGRGREAILPALIHLFIPSFIH
jgi:hypothetical protein